MSQHHYGGRTVGAADYSIQLKTSVITLRKINGMQYRDIEVETGVKESQACKIYNKAKREASNDDLRSLLATLSSKSSRPGKKPKVANGSRLSARIRSEILDYGNYKMQDAVEDVLKEEGITLGRRQIEDIAYIYRDPDYDFAIVRGVRPKKPSLNESDRDLRIDYSYWLIASCILIPRLIFVSYDETSKTFGGNNIRGGKHKISRPKGRDANEFAIYKDPPFFKLSICAATSTNTTI